MKHAGEREERERERAKEVFATMNTELCIYSMCKSGIVRDAQTNGTAYEEQLQQQWRMDHAYTGCRNLRSFP